MLRDDFFHIALGHGWQNAAGKHDLNGHSMLYICPKCVQGRSAPPGVERTYIPKECRNGKLFAEPAASSSSPATEATPPVRSAVTTPIQQLMGEYRAKAMKQKGLDEVVITKPEHFPEMSAIDRDAV